MLWSRNIFPGTNLNDINLDWILKKLKALRGGSTGQVLFKKSSADFDVEWKDVSTTGDVTREEFNDLSDEVSLLDDSLTNQNDFINTLLPNLAGKKVSIIGDSISTYDQQGYKYGNYAQYYPTSAIPDVDSVNKTWWKMILDLTGATLEVNASYAGSCATNVRPNYPSFADRCSQSILGNPDVVIVALGTNDSAESVSIGNYNYESAYSSLDESTFANAYIKGIKKLKAIYPNADIVCVSLRMSNNYAVAISYIAGNLNCKYVYCGSYVGAVASHPAYAGMRQITANVLFVNPSYTGGYGLMTGAALTKTNYVLSNANQLSETPSSTRSFNRFIWQDASANEITRFAVFKSAAGRAYLQMRAHNLPSNAYNTLTLGVENDGTPVVELEQNAWLDALQAIKYVSYGIYANTPASITCTTIFRGLLVINAGSSDSNRYGLYFVGTTSAGIFYDPIAIKEASIVTFSKDNKTLTITATAACKANFILFDRGGELTITGNA